MTCGKRLGRDWEDTGKRLGRDWDAVQLKRKIRKMLDDYEGEQS